jgi:carbon monoxide dehydrogenase subunit G
MRMEITTEIDCPPDALWPWIEEPGRQQRWMKGLVSNELTSPPPSRKGSTFVMRIREGRRIGEYTGEVTRHERPRDLGVRIRGGCGPQFEIEVDYHLEDLGGRTRLDYRCSTEMKGIWRILGAVFGVFAKMQAKSFLRTLKKVAEAER